MREIEFRGQRADTKEWIYGDITFTNYFKKEEVKPFILNPIDVRVCGYNAICHEVITETVGQYTGIKDINGKEIYEGDIIRASNGINEIMGVVKFGEYEQDGSGGEYNPIRCIGFYVERVKTIPNEWEKEEGEIFYEPDYEETQSPFCCKWLEVIGNIYENPELLEVSK